MLQIIFSFFYRRQVQVNLLKLFVCAYILVKAGSVYALRCEDVFNPSSMSDYVSEKGPFSLENIQQADQSRNLSQLVRSNSNQFWSWSSQKASEYFSQSILNLKGLVVGDPHNKNFGLVSLNGKVKWSLVDFDDPGYGPYILDIVRFLAASKAVTKDIKSKVLWDFYLKGLKGESIEVPSALEKYLDITAEQYEKLETNKAEKFIKNDKLLNDGVESSEIENVTVKSKILNLFAQHLPDYRILDVGGREKDRGGSQDAMRFVALAEKANGSKVIFELKESLGSALKFYEAQSLDLTNILTFYLYKNNPSAVLDKSYQKVNLHIEGKDREFLLRPKQLYFFDAANSANNKKEYAEFEMLTFYNAWYLGKLHGEQSRGRVYLETITSGAEQSVLDSVKEMSKDYLAFLEKHL